MKSNKSFDVLGKQRQSNVRPCQAVVAFLHLNESNILLCAKDINLSPCL